MRKILFGLMGLVLTVSVGAGTAYALFFDTATVGGVAFTSGSADLKVWDGDSFEDTWNPSTLVFANLFPNYGLDDSHFQTFYLKNTSPSAINLTIAAQLRDGVTESQSGSWEALKGKVWVKVRDMGTGNETGWQSLNAWNQASITLPGGVLPQNQQREYRFFVGVDSAAGNEIVGHGLTDVNFDFTGTQQL